MVRQVPALTQYASEDLIAGILYGGRDRTDDPRWRESGAPNLAAYEHWTVRWCGMACLRMALLARDGTAPSLYELTLQAKAFGAYTDEPGRPEGLLYHPFVDFVEQRHSLHAEVVTDLTSSRLCRAVQEGRLVIASVHPEVRRADRPAPAKRGGHLVLVTAVDGGSVTFHDPSGHHAQAVVATLPMSVFDRFATGRGIVLYL